MVLIVSIGEKLDKATGLMAEAKEILEKPDVREKMRIESYLGELGETECLNVALIKAEEAVKILSEYMPENVEVAKTIVDNIHKRLDKLNKPKIPVKPKPATELKKETNKPTKKKRDGKKKRVVNK